VRGRSCCNAKYFRSFLGGIYVDRLKTDESEDLRGQIRALEARLLGCERDAEEKTLQAQNALADLQQRTLHLEAVLQSIDDGVVVCDEEGRFLVFNQAAERIVGTGATPLPPEAWTGHYGIFDPQTMQPLATEALPMVRAMQGEAIKTDVFIRNPNIPDGVLINVAAHPLRTSDERNRGGVVIFRDVTRQKAREDLLHLLSEAVEQSPNIALITDPNGDIQYVNRRFEEITGYRAEEVHGTKSASLGRNNEAVEREVWETLKAGNEWRGEFHNYRKDGTDYWESAAIRPIRNQRGDVTHYLKVAQDVTERRRMEQALEKSESRFRLLVESNILAVLRADLVDGRIVEANDAFLRMIGYSREELERGALRCHDLTPPEHHALDERSIEMLRKRLVCPPFEKEYIRKDGSRVPILLAAFMVESSEREFVCFVLDLSEQKRAEDELKRSNQELEHFAYIVSHDLQEPLRMVTGFLQLLAQRYQGKLGEDADEFIGFSLEGASRMQQLIQDLLAYARVGTGGPPTTATGSQAALEMALANLRAAMDESAAAVTWDDALPTVRADDMQLVQIFQNLLGNAIKFRSTSPPRIHVSAVAEAPYWRFSVTDNGIGVPDEHLQRIFTIFQRVHGRNAYEGTGIGLSICKKIVERHGGRIWAESNGQGATFCFTLPQDPAGSLCG
jgi:PAS domain S-box-containing protein